MNVSLPARPLHPPTPPCKVGKLLNLSKFTFFNWKMGGNRPDPIF